MNRKFLSAYALGQLRLRTLWLLVIGCGVLSLAIGFGVQLVTGAIGRWAALDPSFS
jgi:hypothetical protein